MKIILKYLRGHGREVFLISLFLAIRALCDLGLPRLMQDIVNNGVLEKNTNYILKTGSIMLLVTFISMGANILVVYISSIVGNRISLDLRKKVFSKTLNFSGEEVDKFGVSSLITRTTNDITQIQTVMFMFLRVVLYFPLLAVGGIYMIARTNSGMNSIIVVAVSIMLCIIYIIARLIIPKVEILQKLIDNINRVAREMLTGLSVIRAFGREQYMENKFDEANKELTKTNLSINTINAFMFPSIGLIMNFTMVGIIWVGAYRIQDGRLDIGQMMSFIQYSALIISSFLMISMIFIMIPRAIVSAKRVDEVLNEPLSIKETEKDYEIKSKGLVEFKNVSFRHNGADEDVLKNISFVSKPGETTAFIGSTGSGKSTIVNLLARLYDVTEGEILVDGINIKDMHQTVLHSKLGVVPQKGVLFTGTIRSNIKFGGDNITDEQMYKAADIAQATDFINAKENKWDEEISQGGTNVSGGQRQRLAIARAIAVDPEILVFDDSFSALDYKTDKKLRDAISKNLADKTVLIVAQRVNTIKNANTIIVLEEGEVVGQGTHRELLKTCEVYREIANSQLSKGELANG